MGDGEGFFGEPVASFYDERAANKVDPAVVGPVVELLGGFAGDGGALEFGIGTGRIALSLAERGVRVAGVDNSESMVARLRFVIETHVPELQSLPPGQTILPFRADPEGISVDVWRG